MTTPPHILRSMLLGAAFMVLPVTGCSEGGAGASCEFHSDCAGWLQCLDQICVPRCESHRDCSDGFQCLDNGVCEAVRSQVGDNCRSEWECGVGQSCVPDTDDENGDGVLGASCQVQVPGGNVGASCVADADCSSQFCSLGRCSQMCSGANLDECPSNMSCQEVPRWTAHGDALARGCLQRDGVISSRITMTESSERLRVPVPSGAKSMSLVARVADESHTVGASRVVAPSGVVLYSGSDTPEEVRANPIRYVPQRQLSTLLIPNRDTLELETGHYVIDVEATLPRLPGDEFGEERPPVQVPEVEVFYKMGIGRNLDLHFYFLDLADHPCWPGDVPLSAVTARNGMFQDYLTGLQDILSAGALSTRIMEYRDLSRPDLDSVEAGELGTLFSESDNDSGVAVFFVRSLAPDGIQAQVGGTPGPPLTPGTPASGIAISLDTLCYRSIDDWARVTAHSIARQMGLFNNRDPEGMEDPISDTGGESTNLMFFGEFGGGTELTEGQKKVLGNYPGLR